MRNLIVLLFLLFTSNQAFSQSIEGKWVLDLYPNTMYIFEDGLRYTYYCIEDDCQEFWNNCEAGDANALPQAHEYTFENNHLTIDLNFGNIFFEELSFTCNGNKVVFASGQSSMTRLGAICDDLDLGCTDQYGYHENGSSWSPSPCEMFSCMDGYIAQAIIDCPQWMGVLCEGEWVLEDGACCAVCIPTMPLCASTSGVPIMEAGDWTNPNDPCEVGYCAPDGFFSQIIYECAQDWGLPCDGEWVLQEGQCCAECVPNSNDCLEIVITLNQGWNMIGFACNQNTEATQAFSSIYDKIIIAKDAVGNAYLPEYDFNGIGDLERGYGYLIKVSESIVNYNVCD